jgi:hypothetical protein
MSNRDERNSYSSAPAEGFSVCTDCFDDEDIEAFIESKADSRICDFCRRKSRTRSIAAPLEEVLKFIFSAIDREYEKAVDALGWDEVAGMLGGPYWDSRKLLTDVISVRLPNDRDGRLLDLLTSCLGREPWCNRDPYSLRKDDQLNGSWGDFCKSVKHKRRYFFLHQSARRLPYQQEYLSPAKLLEFINTVVDEQALVKELPKGSLIYRARQQRAGKVLDSPYDFGPPPVESATRSNRMSPAGIVMFYGSDDRETAVAEIDDDPRLGIVVGTFRTTRIARVLDLTRFPRRLRFFEPRPDSNNVDRYALNFLHSFVRSLAAKVEPGGREHVDYVPTQVVTEWFRSSYRYAGSPLDGIRYASAQRATGKSLVLFADRYDVLLNPKEIAELIDAGARSQSLHVTDEWWARHLHARAWLKLVRKRTMRRPQV